MKKRFAPLFAVALLLLSSCAIRYQQSNATVTGRPNAVDPRTQNSDRVSGVLQVWVGSSRSQELVTGVKVEYRHTGTDIKGNYSLGKIGVDSFGHMGRGSLVGTVTGGVVEARLTLSDACSYTRGARNSPQG